MPEFTTRIVDFGPCECCATSSSSSDSPSSSSSGPPGTGWVCPPLTGWVCPPTNDGYICTGYVCVKECQCPTCDDPFAITGTFDGIVAIGVCYGGVYIGQNTRDDLFGSGGYAAWNYTATCLNGDWLFAASMCFFDGAGCVTGASYRAVVLCKDTDEDGLPRAGTINLERVDDGGPPADDCEPAAPTITITK